MKLDQLGGKGEESLALSLRISAFNEDILTLHIAELLQLSQKGRSLPLGFGGRRSHPQKTDAVDLSGRRRRGERYGEDAEGEGDDESDGSAIHGGLLGWASYMPWNPESAGVQEFALTPLFAGGWPAL
jgi:hypothetical protein